MSVAKAGKNAAETCKQRLDIDLLKVGNKSESANNEDSPLTLAQLPDSDPFMERILARPSSSPVQAISNDRRTPRQNVRSPMKCRVRVMTRGRPALPVKKFGQQGHPHAF